MLANWYLPNIDEDCDVEVPVCENTLQHPPPNLSALPHTIMFHAHLS